MRGFAFCNDLYGATSLEDVAVRLALHGYDGLELDARALGGTDPRRLADRCASLGISIVGLHWLLAGTDGLHLTHPDADVRRATLRHLRDLARKCAELGGTVMVLGGGRARRALPGVPHAQALAHAREVLAALGDELVRRGVYLGIEPLEPASCNLINTAEAAAALAESVGCPNVGITLDARAMESEALPREEVVRRYARPIVHVHVSDASRRGPGMGETDLGPMLRAVREVGYRGWISVEAFDPTPDPDTVAERSLLYLHRQLSRQPSVREPRSPTHEVNL